MHIRILATDSGLSVKRVAAARITPAASYEMDHMNRVDRQSAPATAVEMASRQREISISEFFLKNRHLLGV